MPDDLAAGDCVPCRAGSEALPREEQQALLRQVPDWTLAADGRSIGRSYGFRDFADAYRFVSRIAELAEAQGHHPDLGLGWGYVTVSLRTHAINGLHRNDFILAARIGRIFAGQSGTRP